MPVELQEICKKLFSQKKRIFHMQAQSERQSSSWNAYLILFSCYYLEDVLEINIEFKIIWTMIIFSSP